MSAGLQAGRQAAGAEGVVYLDGRLVAAGEACVSVFDRGFLFGDGVYEVVPCYGGRLFRPEAHLRRLQGSLDAVRIANPHGIEAWRAILEDLVARNGGGDLSVYLQVTRGVSRRDHAFPPDAAPTVFAMASPIYSPDPRSLSEGVAAVTRDDIRWQRCDIKAITLLANVLLRQEAIDAGAAEAILVRDGYATEGAASNLFVVHDGVIRTPPKGPSLLPGITRDLVVELADKHGLACEQREVSVESLRRADEIWLTSSTREVVPVTVLDGQHVGQGRPGPLWRQVYGLYQTCKQALRRGASGC